MVRTERCFLMENSNDEALLGHPLYERGLRPYAAFEIENTSWVRALDKLNRVHPRHSPRLFAGLKHFIFAFHESVFECIAESCTLATHRGSRRVMFPLIAKNLR